MNLRLIPLTLLLTLVSIGRVAAKSEAKPTFPLTRVYDKSLGDEQKLRAIAATTQIFEKLGIELRHDESTIVSVVAGSGDRLAAKEVDDVDLLYDAVYYLTDLARLPAGLYPLYSRLLVVADLKAHDSRARKMVEVPIAYDPKSRFILIDNENLNQLETFGSFTHPKINYAMILQCGIEARLGIMGVEVVRELGVDLVVDDDEWVRLNGKDDGWSVYNGEKVTFVGLKASLRVTPPGILIDSVREMKSGVSSDVYPGFPDASQPWWSPRHSPQLERDTIMRSMFSRKAVFFNRLSGRHGEKKDPTLREKTRLILYAGFVASGGKLNHEFWMRRHPSSSVVDELTKDFNDRLLIQLRERLERNPATEPAVLD